MKTIQETDLEFICDIQAPCFQSLMTEEIELVKSSKTQIIFRKGDSLTKQGAFTSYVLFIIHGVAKQYVEDNGVKSFNIQIVQSGEFVGLSAVFTNTPFNYSTTALTNCQAFLIEKDAIMAIAKKNSTFGFDIIKRHCERNGNLYDALRTVLYKQMNGRLAQTLLYLDEFKPENESIFPLLTRKDVADFANVSPENAVKLLKTFEKEGLIALNEKDIVIVNKEKLGEISKRG